MLAEKDLLQLKNLGISEEEFEKQISNFERGSTPLALLQACAVGEGISQYDAEKQEELIKLYNRFKDSLDIVKFVPASGAATRMFKALFLGLHELETGQEINADATRFINELSSFPFFDKLKSSLEEQEMDLNDLLEKGEYSAILEAVLDKSGLDYGNLPKALIEFHIEGEDIHTSLECHFIELLSYAFSEDVGRLHLTVSPEHLSDVKELSESLAAKYSKEMEIRLEYSVQGESTNTVAVFNDNTPVRNRDGSLMFRPGGHGALLKNLNEIRAQLIFIKNIDNVSKLSWNEKNSIYKELLAGRLLEMRENIHNLLNGLVHKGGIEKAKRIIYERWGKEVSTVEEIVEVLDRPIRVCGMVKNTGAPGGGPFWVGEPDGSRNMQIVESSQIDMENPEQFAIWQNATHFNPVDLVCWVENHSGVKFDLLKYRDDNTGFISSKTFEGKEIKAQELPGLWNGAMSGWITEFVEVPLHTFNPVKTVLDLLNEGHRAE